MGDFSYQFKFSSVKSETCNAMQDEISAKCPRSDDKSISIRFLIKSEYVGAIIGKGGSNINRLRTKYQASVTVSDCSGPERILTIGLNSEEILGGIIQDILSKLNDNERGIFPGMHFDYELRLLLHTEHLTGKGESRIKELRNKTGVQIKIFSNCCPNSTERIVQVIGYKKEVVICVKEIICFFSQASADGSNKQYDPHHFNPMYANNYGGYGASMQKGYEDGDCDGFEIKILVKSLKTSECKTVILKEVEPSDTIAYVKAQINKKEHIPPKSQKYSFAGKDLEDNRTLSHYGIDKNAILNCTDTDMKYVDTVFGRAYLVDSPNPPRQYFQRIKFA